MKKSSVFIGMIAAVGFVGCAANTPKKDDVVVIPPAPTTVTVIPTASSKMTGFHHTDFKSRLPANSQSDECDLIPSGVYFGHSERITSGLGDEKRETSVDNTPTHIISDNDGDMGSLGDICSDIKRGAIYNFPAKSDHSVVVTMKILGDGKEIGDWNSNTDMAEPDKHCAPSSDATSYAIPIQLEYKKHGKVIHSAKSTLYQTTTGGYHGYWGQGDCPAPE